MEDNKMYGAEKGRSPQILRTVINGSLTTALVEGSTARLDWENYYDAQMKALPILPMGSSVVGDFAGVLVKKVPKNANFVATTQTANALCVQGVVTTRFLGHASAKAGSWARPVVGQNYMTYSAEPTGIKLLVDMSADTDLHGPGLGDTVPPVVEILPGAMEGTYIWEDPIAADADRLLVDEATSASAITTSTTFVAQPDVARNIEVLPGGTTADVPAGDVTINGTDIEGNVISEAVTFAANATTKQVTAKAFKTVTSVVFPIQDGAGATYDVGIGDKLGLTWAYSALRADYAVLGTTLEGTLPTLAANVTTPSANTVDLNSALDGSEVTLKLTYGSI
jgi:hypothetical protein